MDSYGDRITVTEERVVSINIDNLENTGMTIEALKKSVSALLGITGGKVILVLEERDRLVYIVLKANQ